MLNFILNNVIFDYIIIFLFIINFVLTAIIDLKQMKFEFKNIFKLNIIKQIKMILMIITILLISIVTCIKQSNFVHLIIYFILPIILLIKTIFDTYKKQQILSVDDKYYRLWAACIFIVFFSSNSVSIYYETLSSLNHITKEILFIVYLLTKIILFTFFLFTNLAILVSNINILIPIKLKEKSSDNKYFKFKDYNFFLFRKFNYKLFFVVDIIIYFFLCLPTIIINIVAVVFLKCIKVIKNIFSYTIYKIYNFNNNSNEIVKNITNISIITAFSIVYIITIIYSSIFTKEVTEIYSFLSTVILIPFIYDTIK